MITLDEETWELALQKANFSSWVRNQLRSERNKEDGNKVIAQLEKDCELFQKQADMWWRLLMEEKERNAPKEDEEE